MMTFTDFRRLYSEAMEANDIEMYIAERGWQDWMDDDNNPADTLTSIYSMANGGINDIIATSKLSKAAFYRTFAIPERSLFNWVCDNRPAPPYILLLLAYAALNIRWEARHNDTDTD